jgi:mannan endo-1,4-beta-mannosidase
MHTYSWDGNWNPNGPFKVTADSYSLDKPLVIGEFSSACAVNEGVDALWDYAYNNGYDGLWSWQYNAEGHCTDTQSSQTQGMQHIRNYNNSGAINVGIN